jgi:hypothetical protein
MAHAKATLADWWFTYLTGPQRERLMRDVGQPLDPDLALVLWRSSRALRIVEPEVWSVGADPNSWRLTGEVVAFITERARERPTDLHDPGSTGA